MLGICKAIGNIDAATAPAFNADLHDTIDGSDEAFVSVDCSDVTFMDSTAIGALMDFRTRTMRAGGSIALRGIQPTQMTLVVAVGLVDCVMFDRDGNARAS